MTDRRVLTWADNEAQANKRLEGYQDNPTAKVEEGTWPNTDQRWAVTAARVKKGDQT